MIKRITDISKLKISDSYYGGKIRAYAEAYGLNYDFCRFYSLKNGTLLLNNSNCIIDGSPDINDELIFFITMNGASTVESPLKLHIDGYSEYRRTLFEMTACGKNIIDETELRHCCGFEDIYRILERSFGNIPHDLWYSDISHRVRHGVSETFLYNKTAAVLDFIHGGYGYLSNIATDPNHRNCGSCRKLLTYIGGKLSEKGISCRLFAYDDKVPFYEHLGHKRAGEDMYLIINDQ